METKINKQACSILELAAKEKTRYALNGINVEVKEACTDFIATDGRVLAVVRSVNEENATQGACIVPYDVIKGIARDFPSAAVMKRNTRAKAKTIRAINSPMHESNNDGPVSEFEIVGMSKSETESRTIARPVDGRYPDWKGVIPKNDPKDVFFIDAHYLKKMAEALIKFGGDEVRVETNGHTSAVTFKTRNVETEQDFLGMVMPVTVAGFTDERASDQYKGLIRD